MKIICMIPARLEAKELRKKFKTYKSKTSDSVCY